MRILVISDLHYETGKRRFHFPGMDEAKSLPWLYDTMDRVNPNAIIILGDTGSSMTRQDWDQLVAKYTVYALYGNHDYYHMMKRIRNVDGTPMLMRDGEIKELDGLRFGFINGIVTHTGKQKKGVPRKTPEQFIDVAKSMHHSIDFLCTHESPPVMLYRKKLLTSENVLAAKVAADVAEPKITLSGHLGFGPYTVAPIIDESNILSVRLDSDQRNKGYAVINTRNRGIVLYEDTQPKYKLRIPANKRELADIIANADRFNAGHHNTFASVLRTAETEKNGIRNSVHKIAVPR